MSGGTAVRSLYSEVPCPGGRGLGGVCTVRSNVQGNGLELGVSLYGEVQCILGNGHMGTLL